jgi:ABC-2 type transport system permease protein
MKAVFALYRAQAREFLRNRSTLLFVLLLPVGFGVFFGLAFSRTDSFRLTIGVVDEDTGQTGAALVDGLMEQTSDGLVLVPGSRDDLLEELHQGRVQAVMILPADLTGGIAQGESRAVEVFYDPASSVSAGIGLSTVRTLLEEVNLSLSQAPRLLVMKEASVQVRHFRAVDYYLPGMLGVALLWLGVFGTAQPAVMQRQGQILRRFSVTAIKRRTILTAEVAWRVSVGLMQAAIFVIIGYFGFGVGIARGLTFASAALLGTVVFVSLGYVLAGIGRSMESTMAIAQMINFPTMMLSGSIFPAESLPGFFQPIVKVLPLTYLSELLRQSMVGLPGLIPPATAFAVLGAWAVVLLLLAVRLWRWE